MNFALLAINITLMLVIPVVLAIFIHRRTSASWRFFFIGAVTFILSQVLHIPFNWLVGQTGLLPDSMETTANLLITAIFLGLSAGVFEETARYLAYRFWARDARSWSRGLMLGAGHGGIESILVGVLSAVSIIGLVVTVNNEAIMSTIPADQQAIVTESLASIMDQPWYALLLGAAERVFAITAHLAMSLMVLQVFLRRSLRWLFLSIGYHTLLNALAVVVVTKAGPYAAEGALAVFSLLSLFIIFKLRTPEPEPVEPEPLPETDLPLLVPTDDAIDRSKYG